MRFRPALPRRPIARAGRTAASALAAIAALAPSMLAAQAARPPAPRPAAQASYAINVNDELEIYVWGEERLQRTLRVLPDGSVAFPLVGQIKVQGLLPQDVEKLVGERLKSQYRGDVPNVTVSVRNPAGMLFSVLGKVRAPGTFTPGRFINVLDAVSLAGGPAEFANMENVVIIRHEGDHLVTLRARLGSVFRSGVSSGDLDRANIIPLVPGDTVIVP